MYSEQAPYRELYDAILDYEGDEVHRDVLAPWLAAAEDERRWLEAFGKRRGAPVPSATSEELCRLFALSRVAQTLIRLDPGQFASFMDGLGLARATARAFHPFLHEIVTVDEADGEAMVVEEYWPAYMLGPLLIARAGCRVAARPDVIRKQIAETSTLYWATARANERRTDDLSHGWGSNSSWRTSFRRDYLIDGVRYYNVDPIGTRRDDDLSDAERLELLRHRCFVTCTKRHDGRWPYAESFQEDARDFFV